jgi:4-aminobutyrate aminotransferase
MTGKHLTTAELVARDRAIVAPTIYRYTGASFQRGEGVYLYDWDGREYLDLAAGICTMNVGHCHPEVVAAICDQARTLIHGASHIGYLAPYVEILEALRAIGPGELARGKGLLMNSGSEAVETGIKLARYVTNRPMILAFTDSFHGRPMGALALTASNAGFRRRMTGLLVGVHHLPYPYCYRCPLKHSSPQTCGLACLNLVEKALATVVPPEDLAAIAFEPIAGEGGYIVPPDGFLQGLRAICDRTGALLIADEVQTGLGRTGKMFAVEHWGVVPDILCLAKALGGGLPLGAVLAKAEIVDAWPPGAHGTTFGGNPVACRAGLAALQILLRDGLVDHAARLGAFVQERLRAAQEALPMIGDVRGKGLMAAAELVNSDGSPATGAIGPVIDGIVARGVVITKCGTSTVRIAPPLTISQEQLAAGLETIVDVVREQQA